MIIGKDYYNLMSKSIDGENKSVVYIRKNYSYPNKNSSLTQTWACHAKMS